MHFAGIVVAPGIGVPMNEVLSVTSRAAVAQDAAGAMRILKIVGVFGIIDFSVCGRQGRTGDDRGLANTWIVDPVVIVGNGIVAHAANLTLGNRAVYEQFFSDVRYIGIGFRSRLLR